MHKIFDYVRDFTAFSVPELFIAVIISRFPYTIEDFSFLLPCGRYTIGKIVSLPYTIGIIVQARVPIV